MFLKFRANETFLDLHLTTGLHDWDMNEEVHLSTTTDQFSQGKTSNIYKVKVKMVRVFLKNGHFSTDEKGNEQYLAQWHYARVSRRTLAEELHQSNPAECEGEVT